MKLSVNSVFSKCGYFVQWMYMVSPAIGAENKCAFIVLFYRKQQTARNKVYIYLNNKLFCLLISKSKCDLFCWNGVHTVL